MKPLIGVTGWLTTARWDNYEGRTVLVEGEFADKLQAAGAAAVVIPPHKPSVPEVIAPLDGLVLSGGPDIDPGHYGRDRHENTDVVEDATRDEGDIALIRAALEIDLPVLAICRGCQVLNVACGGTLVQHVPELAGDVSHRPEPPGTSAQDAYVPHQVTSEPGSVLAELMGERFEVLSWHHQAIDELGEGLEVVGRADDGLVEAIAAEGKTFALGVQWHPEPGNDARLFEGVVGAAREFREHHRGDRPRPASVEGTVQG